MILTYVYRKVISGERRYNLLCPFSIYTYAIYDFSVGTKNSMTVHSPKNIGTLVEFFLAIYLLS